MLNTELFEYKDAHRLRGHGAAGSPIRFSQSRGRLSFSRSPGATIIELIIWAAGSGLAFCLKRTKQDLTLAGERSRF